VLLAELADQVHYTKGYLSKIETGKKRLTPELARLLDQVLQTGGVLAGLLADRAHPAPGEEEPDSAGSKVCPYPGLVAFGSSDARWFFGREQAIADLVGRLDEHLTGGGPLVVVAPSGAGKSSLLAAGLIPVLAGGALPGSGEWPVVVTTPGAHPLASLAARVAEQTGASPVAAAAASVDPESFTAFISTVADSGGKQGETSSSGRAVLIVDQFEEVFTECREGTERHAFITALVTAASGAALVVLGVRADFYGSCLAYPPLLTALQTPLALGPMNAEQLREIITGPARTEGLRIEPGLVELLLRDLGVTDNPEAETISYDPGALPLLAHALRATWQLRSDHTLTVAGYQRTGGIHQALASTADRAYARLNSAEQRIAQQIVLRLVNVGEHGSDTRHRLPRTHLIQALPAPAETIETVLEVLGRARLITLGADRDTGVEITHEALLRAWPRLAGWISADRAGLRTHQQLAEAAQSWEQAGRDPSSLYRGTQLALARTWASAPGHGDRLSPLENAYLDASIDQEHREQHTEQRRTRRLRTSVTALAVLLIVALLACGIAYQQKLEADKQNRLAKATQFAAISHLVAATYPDTAMLAAVKAYNLLPGPMTLSALLSAQSHYFAGQLSGHTDTINTAMFSPDGRTLATASDDGTARLWDVASHQLITLPLDSHTGPIDDAEFSPDGRVLATAGRDGTARLWDVPTHQPRDTFPGGPGATLSTVTFSHDGQVLATASTDGIVLWDLTNHHKIATIPKSADSGSITKVIFSPKDPILATEHGGNAVQLWNVADLTHPTPLGPPLIGHSGHINKVVFSYDGHKLATGSDDQTARLWNVTDPTHPTPLGPPLTGHTNAVTSVAFDPDGLLLATGGSDGTARLWDTTTYKEIGTFRGHNGSILSVTFSPNGHTISTAGNDHIARLWDTRGPIRILSSPATAYGVKFSPDGHTLAIPSGDKTVRLWNVTDPAHPILLDPLVTGDTESVTSVAFSQTRHILTTASANGARLWNTTNNQPMAPLPGPTSFIDTMAFSPDGKTLATSNNDNTVRLWNVTDPTHPTALGTAQAEHINPVTSMAFNSNGHTLATGSIDTTVRLWDVTTPTHPLPLGQPLTGQTGAIKKMMFSLDDRTLITASNDGTVKRWEWTTGRPIPTRSIPTLPGEPPAPVWINSTRHIIATTRHDNTTIKLWNIDRDSDQPITTLTDYTSHTSPIKAAEFSADGNLLATVSNDGTALLWDLNPERVTTRLCHIIGTPSQDSRTEWTQLIPDLPYEPTCP
jgi:WD40 repeat protein